MVQGSVLRRGDTISCGCYQSKASSDRAKSRIIDLVGKKFGLLTVMSRVEKTNKEHNYGFWLCKCECGNEKLVEGYYLRKGMVSSCGCLNMSKYELYVIQYFDELGYEASVDYEMQKRFIDLRGSDDGLLSYDFVLYKNNNVYLIECQGQQHYFPVEIFGGDKQFIKQQYHDKLKKDYAKKINAIYVEIPYTCDTYEKLKHNLDEALQ